MLVPGTQMHFVTFGFICIEILILFYLIIHRFARPDDRSTYLNIILILLLLVYNITGGLLPDPNLPGSYFLQESIAYGTGFITPCYFPYFNYKGFGLEKMRFHAYRGVFFFLVIPYILFVTVFAVTGNLEKAQNILILPVLYGLWVVITLYRAIKFKYRGDFSSRQAKEELVILLFSLTPWIGLPIITYFNLGQAIEAITTNTGFLLLLALHIKRHIEEIREEHRRYIESEFYMQTWNERLNEEVEKRTKELAGRKAEDRILENCKQYHLTNRETEIVQLICHGSTHKQIAENLYIAERTVAKHVQNIFEKVSVSNRMELRDKLGV